MSEVLGTNGNDLTITIPSSGDTDWATSIRNNCFQLISDHKHEASGDGAKIRGYLGISWTDALLPNNTFLAARNNAGTGAVDILKLDTSDQVVLDATGISGTAIKDEDDMVSDSASHLASQQSIKAYVDAQLTAQDLDFQGDSGGALSIDLDSETLTIAGGTGIDTSGATNTLTIAVDSTVLTESSTSTLSNKTLTDSTTTFQDDVDNTKKLKLQLANISTATTRTLTIPDIDDTLITKSSTDTLTNKTLTSPSIDTGVSGTAILDEDNMASDSATQLATQQSIKAYADTKLENVLTATGDIIYSSSGSTAANLAAGTNGHFLTLSAGVPAWTAVTVSPTAVTSKSATYTATTADETIKCDATGGDFTITLYAASGNSGKHLTIINTEATGVVTIDGNASETIDGDTTRTIYPENRIRLRCDGTNWLVEKDIQQKTAFIKDEKSSGTHGGTFTSGAWQTRDLNTLSGDTAAVGVTLSSNQFTLPAGKYVIEAEAIAFDVLLSKAKLRNVTDSTDDIIGTPHSHQTGVSDAFADALRGVITITSSKTFEIQHRCSSTKTTTGFGVASSFSVNEVYTQVKVTRLK